jgi:hypothetical protein
MHRLHLPLILAACNPLLGLDLAVCSDRPKPVDPMTQTEFQKELARIASRSGIEARFVPCSHAVGTVRLRLMEAAPAEEPSALGAAVRDRKEIRPDLRIFVGPIARLVGTRLPYLLGMAMARVAAHELGHYLRQDDTHERDGGIMAAGLTGPKLIAAHDFRIPLAGGSGE